MPRSYSPEAYELAFATLGYSKCSSPSLEEGKEKIAIYVGGEGFEHVARQLPDGRWSSKLGWFEDISHTNLAELEGENYGKAILFMERARPSSTSI